MLSPLSDSSSAAPGVDATIELPLTGISLPVFLSMPKLLMFAVNGLVTKTNLLSFVIANQHAPPAFASLVSTAPTEPLCEPKSYDETELRIGLPGKTSGKCSFATIIRSWFVNATAYGPSSDDGWPTGGACRAVGPDRVRVEHAVRSLEPVAHDEEVAALVELHLRG